MSSCPCDDRWLVEACNLKTGQVQSILHPLSMDWETILNKPGRGSITVPTKDVIASQIWPHLTMIVISRLYGTDAHTPAAGASGLSTTGGSYLVSGKVEFMGYIESFSASDNGATQIGMQSIEEYLDHRILQGDANQNSPTAYTKAPTIYVQTGQNRIASDLVHYTRNPGIPLDASLANSVSEGKLRDRTYNWWDLHFIGTLISNLCNDLGGPDYSLSYIKYAGAWLAEMVFQDTVGSDNGVIFQSDREANGYSLEVDAKDHATYITAVGGGSDAQKLLAYDYDPTSDGTFANPGVYPVFDAAPSWPDVSIIGTLHEHGQGYLWTHQDPIATPHLTVSGPDPDPGLVMKGDTVTVNVNFGSVTFNGKARVIGIGWRVGEGADQRTYTLQPLGRSSDSVLNQIPTSGCEGC